MRLLYTTIVFALVIAACGNGGAVQPGNESNGAELPSSSGSNSQVESPQSSMANQSPQMPCTEAGSYMGQAVTCTLAQAYCSQQPAAQYGENTILCQDKIWPDETFMVTIEGTNTRDFRYYDGKCLTVSGVVTTEDWPDRKMLALELDTVQVSFCP
jgi:hypothetical protein